MPHNVVWVLCECYMSPLGIYVDRRSLYNKKREIIFHWVGKRTRPFQNIGYRHVDVVNKYNCILATEKSVEFSVTNRPSIILYLTFKTFLYYVVYENFRNILLREYFLKYFEL